MKFIPSLVLFIMCVACTVSPSESSIQTAIAQTQDSQLIKKTEEIQTSKPSPTIKPTRIPTKTPGDVTISETSNLYSTRCTQASQSQFDNIIKAVKYLRSDHHIKKAYAVKSNDYENAWFVSAKVYIQGNDIPTSPGVWIIIGDPNNPTIIGSVNSIAQEFTLYPDTSKGTIAATMSKDGAIEAENCAFENQNSVDKPLPIRIGTLSERIVGRWIEQDESGDFIEFFPLNDLGFGRVASRNLGFDSDGIYKFIGDTGDISVSWADFDTHDVYRILIEGSNLTLYYNGKPFFFKRD